MLLEKPRVCLYLQMFASSSFRVSGLFTLFISLVSWSDSFGGICVGVIYLFVCLLIDTGSLYVALSVLKLTM